VNHDDASNFNDLKETLSGELRTTTGEQIATVKNVSEGKLKAARDRIDLFIWIDRKTDRIHLWLFNPANMPHVQTLCSLFGKDMRDIDRK
jgi:hypothetical protein